MTHSFCSENVLVDRSRWAQRRNFSVLQAQFDAGRLFIDTWAAWRDDPQRCERLHFVAAAPLSSLDVPDVLADQPELSQSLIDAWPMRVAGLHRLEFEHGRVVLTLAVGELGSVLQKLWLRADSFYLRLRATDVKLAYIVKALARVAGDQATLCAEAHPLLSRALDDAGFVCDGGETPGAAYVSARFAPRWRVRRHEPPVALAIQALAIQALTSSAKSLTRATPKSVAAPGAIPTAASSEPFSQRQTPRHAIVIGAGLAGCAITERLAARGWRVTLIERHDDLARDASGNPAGVFHPIVWRDDSIAARLTRAGFLYALHRWSELERAGHNLGRSHEGLLQIADSSDDARAIASAIARFGLPASYVVAVDEHEATRLAAQPVARPGWFFPRGGWISPAAICAAQCAAAGDLLTPCFGTQVARIERENATWTAFDTAGHALAQAPVVILANAGDAQRIAGLHGLPTRGVRGQLTLLGPSPLDGLRVPIVGDGYAVPLGAHRTLTGATYDIDDTDARIQPLGHTENLERIARMLPAMTSFEPKPEVLEGRVAFRSVTSDRMPMIGALADESAARANATRLSGAWPLDLPRSPGLYGAFAFGSRGLVWSTLAAELIAAQIEGEPWPIERELAEAIDPARFLLRALRQGEFS